MTGSANTPEDRISKVCEYIQQNLDGDLTLETLSRVAAYSRFHFHRIFTATTGQTVWRFVQLSRLKRASWRLAFRQDMRIISIALEAGYDSPEAFTRAFRRTFHQSPSEFREAPAWPQWHARLQFNQPPRDITHMKVDIIDFSDTPVALFEHQGSADTVNESVSRFIAWRKESGLSPLNSSGTFGIPYGDPKTTHPEHWRFQICGSVTESIPENGHGVINGLIPGGRCAVVRHAGGRHDMDDSIYYLYREWLPRSGEELRDHPCYFQYLNFEHEVDECDLLTDIFLPLK